MKPHEFADWKMMITFALVSAIFVVGLTMMTAKGVYAQEIGVGVEEQLKLAKEGRLNTTTPPPLLSDKAQAARPTAEIQDYCITERFGVGDDSQPTATILIKNESLCKPLVTWYMTYVNSSIVSEENQKIIIEVYKDLP